MNCPHCSVTIHASWRDNSIQKSNGVSSSFYLRAMVCPSCSKEIIKLEPRNQQLSGFVVYPQTSVMETAPKEVPPEIAEDYKEAKLVLDISPKASAALSRRCLQAILDSQGYNAKNLAKQIDSVLAETDARKALPTALNDTIDAIRNFGNFSAHPIDDKTTNQVIPVDPHEARFCLDILDEMFDHFYVRPAKAAARKAALNAKLSAAGKPAAK